MAGTEPSTGADVIYHTTTDMRVKKLSSKEREDMLDLARQRAPDPSIFDEEGKEPFFFTVRASNNKVDSYWTWMDETSLRNYAEDATDPGVQFQVSHNGAGTGGIFGGGSAGEVGFGRSLSGEVKGPSKDRVCLIDFYTVRGLLCGNMTSDQFIDGARSGIYADVSIGFMPGQMLCNVCGNDWLRKWDLAWDDPNRCTHWPGGEYEIGEGTRAKKVTCMLQVMNARLNEVSTVYDGATPGAGIAAVDMARMAAARGEFDSAEIQFMENLYRVRIAPDRVWAPAPRSDDMRGTKKASTPTPPAAEERTKAEEDTTENPTRDVAVVDDEAVVRFEDVEQVLAETAEQEEPLERLRQKYAGTGIRLHDDLFRNIEQLADKCLEQRKEITTLHKDAEYGRQAREELLAELDASVVRAFGSEGAADRQKRYRRAAEMEDVSGIRATIADLEEMAKARLGTGGRLTLIEVPEGEEGAAQTPADKTSARRGPTPARLVG